MGKFRILEHKADLKIKVFGKDKKELFLNALLAMAESMEAEKGKRKAEKRVKISSLDLSALLIDFLSEVLYLTQINKEIYNSVEFKKFSDNKLEAKLTGQKVERFGEDIKAVTYHSLDVHQKKDGSWEAKILFDI